MKNRIKDPAVVQAEKLKDKDFESGSFHFKKNTVKKFGRNRVLKGTRKKK